MTRPAGPWSTAASPATPPRPAGKPSSPPAGAAVDDHRRIRVRAHDVGGPAGRRRFGGAAAFPAPRPARSGHAGKDAKPQELLPQPGAVGAGMLHANSGRTVGGNW